MMARASSRLLLIVASLLSFTCLAAGQNDNDQVKHLMVNDANMIQTARGYAIEAPTLAANNWKTVFRNGDQVTFVSPTCQQTVLSSQSLTQAQQSALEDAKTLLRSAESNQPHLADQMQVYRSGVARFSLQGNMATVSFARNIGVSSFQSNGLSLTKYDDQNMSIGKSTGLPNNLNRIFITGDVVTFVYNDGSVMMKPANCLQNDEQQLVQQLKTEVQQAQGQFQNNMNQFNQNMNNMNRNLQQNMQQLQNNLNNMFNRNNFPFGSNGATNNQYQYQDQNQGQGQGQGQNQNQNQNSQHQGQSYQNQYQYQQPQRQFSFSFPNGYAQGSFMPFMQQLPGLGAISSAFSRAGGALANSLNFGQVRAEAGPFSSSFSLGKR